MSVCTRCGKEVNSIVNCSGAPVCHQCCRACFHYNNEISVLHCGEARFFNQLLQAGINITEDGRIYMAKELFVVVIPPFKPAHISKIKGENGIKEIIHSKVSLKPKSLHCHINGDSFRVIAAAKQDRLSKNEKASSIVDETVKGTAVVVINNFGNFIGIKEKAAKLIADKINEFNSEDIAEDVGT